MGVEPLDPEKEKTMKKKIFLISLMVVALVFALAISAFAEEIVVSKTESAEHGTIIKLNADPGLDNARQYLSTLTKISDDGKDTTSLCILTDDGTSYYVFPSSYVVLEASNGIFNLDTTALVQAISDFNTAENTEYYDAFATSGSGGSKKLDNIVRFEFPSDVTSAKNDVCYMRSQSYLVEVRFNHPIDLSSSSDMFKGSTKLQIANLEKANPNFGPSMFSGCSALESVTLPTGITKIAKSMFWGCKKVVIENLSECTQLTTIGQSAFQDTVSLVFTLPDTVTTIEKSAFQSAFKNGGSITINPTSQLQTIGDYAFHDSRKLGAIYIPSTVTTIGSYAFGQLYALTSVENLENCQVTTIPDNAFKSCIKLKSIKLPKGLITLGDAFGNCSDLTQMYLPDTLTSISDTLTDNSKNILFIYTGDDVSVLSACAKISSATAVKYTYPNEEQLYKDMVSSENTSIIVYSYDKCKAFYNNVHNYIIGTGDCMDGVKCERCPSSLEGTTGHTNYERVTFESLTSNGVREYGCSNDGCTKYDVSETLKPVFTAKGYSTNADKNAINGGYEVNLTSLTLYERFIGTLEYGIVIANASSFGEKTFLDENNKVNSDKALQVEMDKQYSSFDCSINFGTNTGIDLDLVICAYVIEGDTVTYIQSSTGDDVTIGDTTFKSVTLAQVIALVPAESKEN